MDKQVEKLVLLSKYVVRKNIVWLLDIIYAEDGMLAREFGKFLKSSGNWNGEIRKPEDDQRLEALHEHEFKDWFMLKISEGPSGK